MIEERKQKEIEYYDKKAKDLLEKKLDPSKDFEGFSPLELESYRFCYFLLRKFSKDKVVLDYGCGNGIHTVSLAKMGAKKVIGIDLSEKSLKIAKKRIIQENLRGKVELFKMDCEKTDFSDDYFDIIFDGGTFSSLDLRLAFLELARILKKDGKLIGIETFGHNPIANLKRKINKILNKRTDWAVAHIFTLKDLKEAEKYFEKIEVYYFHPISFLVFPFLNLPAGKFLLKLLERIDRFLLFFSFFRKFSFKVVFVFSQPKSNYAKKSI